MSTVLPFFDDQELCAEVPASVFSDDNIVDAAFRHYRATGFPYRKLPIYECMQQINALALTEESALFHTHAAYHVADTYHPHRFHAGAVGMNSPLEAYGDDKLLRRALLLAKKYGSIPEGYFSELNRVSGTQACSNFRPGFAMYMYKKYCRKGDVVLDTSTGYGGRLVGFFASGIAGTYLGIDPNTLTYAGNLQMAADLGLSENVQLINAPAEDVDADLEGFRECCDFAFTSPPYFCKEIYSEEPTQSCNRYKTGEEWRAGFLLPMMQLQYAALRAGALSAVNIADVKIKGTVYPLAKWTKECGEQAGFTYLRTDGFLLPRRFGSGENDLAQEPVIFFRKGEG